MSRCSLATARYPALLVLVVIVGVAVAAPEPGPPEGFLPVVVTVKGPMGRPLKGIRVSVFAEHRGGPLFGIPLRLAGAKTDARGRARLAGLDPGVRCRLVATPPDARWRDYADLCVPGWQPAETTVKLESANVLRGVVRDARGEPVPYATVYLDAPPFRGETVAAGDGQFAFENLSPGQATVHAGIEQTKGARATSPRKSVPTNQTGVVLVLAGDLRDPKPSVIVRVATPNGRPVAFGDATFYSTTTTRGPMGTSTSSYTGGDAVRGGVARSDKFDVALWIEVLGARTEFGESLQFGPGRGGPIGPGPRESRIELPPELAISGIVLGPEGVPLGGIRVQAVPAHATDGSGAEALRWSPTPHGEGISDLEGHYRVGGLEQRRYHVGAKPTADYVPGASVEVPAGAGDVEVRVRLAAKPQFTIKDPKGAPLRGAVIRIRHQGTDEFMAPTQEPIDVSTDASGAARVAGLDPEVGYKLTVYPPTERADLLSWEIPGWLPEDTVLTLERGRLISGAVHDQRGRPIPRARLVWAHVPEAVGERVRALGAEADDEGRFTLKSLHTGSYRIWVRAPLRTAKGTAAVAPLKTSAPKDLEPTVVASGTEDVVLVLPMPSKLLFKVRGWMKKVGSVKALLVPEGGRGEGKPLVKKIGKDGTVVFEDLQWDVKYVFWVGAVKEDAYVYEPGLFVDDGHRDYRLQQGHVATGRLVSPSGTASRKVWAAYPGFEVKGKLKAAGRFEIHGLPAGPWTIRASGRKGKTNLSGETTSKPGEEIVVTLAAE